jgi:hypothetical protein
LVGHAAVARGVGLSAAVGADHALNGYWMNNRGHLSPRNNGARSRTLPPRPRLGLGVIQGRGWGRGRIRERWVCWR